MLRQGGKRTLTLERVDGSQPRAIGESIDVAGTSDWSPDGQWVVVGGDDGKGQGLFKIPVDGGEPVRLTTGPAFDPVWSPAEDLIVYAGANVGGRAPLRRFDPMERLWNCRQCKRSPAPSLEGFDFCRMAVVSCS